MDTKMFESYHNESIVSSSTFTDVMPQEIPRGFPGVGGAFRGRRKGVDSAPGIILTFPC